MEHVEAWSKFETQIHRYDEIVGEEEVSDFVTVDAVVALSAPKKSMDTFWLIKVARVNQVHTTTEVDSYQHEIAPGMVHLSGHFLERDEKLSTVKSYVFNQSKDITFFYKESILYPYVNVKEKNNKLILSTTDYTDILYYIEKNGFSHLW